MEPLSSSMLWVDVKHILDYASNDVILYNNLDDLDILENRLLQLHRHKWLIDSSAKTKLAYLLRDH